MTTTCGLLAVSLTLGACGGGSSSSSVTPAAYVKSICQAVGPFEKDVQSRSSALNLGAIKNPAQGKTALQGFLTAVASDTDQAVSKLKAAGSPDVKNGKQISTAIVSAFTQLRGALSQAVELGERAADRQRGGVQDRRGRARQHRADLDEQHRLRPHRPRQPGARERGQEGARLPDARTADRSAGARGLGEVPRARRASPVSATASPPAPGRPDRAGRRASSIAHSTSVEPK